MQTFLPYQDFELSAKCLDYRRLGKQRVECKQIFMALTLPNNSWANHPATKMWREYKPALIDYAIIICQEWIDRGYKDSLLSFFWERRGGVYKHPHWLTDEFCRSHQSNLVRKFPEHYRQYFPDVPDDLPYIWPVS